MRPCKFRVLHNKRCKVIVNLQNLSFAFGESSWRTSRLIMAESVFEKLLGDKLCGKNGDVKTADLEGEGKTVGLYFSAHWCPPCRGFTPKLAEFYKKHHGEKKFEIVFVSSDKNEHEFQEYYGQMPWLALPYADRNKKVSLSL